MFGPNGVAMDSSGNCYDADWLSNRVRKITPAGVVTTLAGGGGGTGTTAGMVYATGTTALFNQPAGLGIDSNDVLYVSTNTYCLITAITPAGVTSFFAGGGGASGTSAQCGTADGAAASASFQNPVWISLDSTNTFYVADRGSHRVRKITPAGVVSTYAGGGGGSNSGTTDGIGTAALFNNPNAVDIDAEFNVFVADQTNNRIRKIAPGGVVTTFAGSTAGNKDAVGTLALFSGPRGIALDSSLSNPSIYVVDTGNHKMRVILQPSRAVYTIAGGGAGGTSSGSTNGVGSNAAFNTPYGWAFDANGNVCIGDNNNQLIRYIPAPTAVAVSGSSGQVLLDGTEYGCPTPQQCGGCTITLGVVGGGGGGGSTNTGGVGASITATLALSSQAGITTFVTNFGRGGSRGAQGGGGGAATSITSIIGNTLTLIAIAGGGGGGATTSGGAGGPVLGSGGTASNNGGNGGAGGSQTTAGAGGTGSTAAGAAATGGGSTSPGTGGGGGGCTGGCIGAYASAPGWNAYGGYAATFGTAGGSGGGGWYGGGGGGVGWSGSQTGAGGGGGSSWVNTLYVTASGVGTTPSGSNPGSSSSSTAGYAGVVTVISVVPFSCTPQASASLQVSASPQASTSGAPTRSLVPSRSFASPSAVATTSPCPGGYYCATPGGPATMCPGGWYCPVGSTTWNSRSCGLGSYCPAGSSAPISCGARNTVGPLGVRNGPAYYVDTAACAGHCYNGGAGQLSTCA